jgi:type II secretory pathway component PulC
VVEEDPEDQSTAATSLDEVQLVGIFGAGDSAGIITLAKGKKQRILLGEDIEGWTLDDIKPDRAVFKDRGQTHEVMLKPPSNSKKGKDSRKSKNSRKGKS